MVIKGSYVSEIKRKYRSVPVFKSFVVLTLLCVVYTLCLVSISLRAYDFVTVGTPDDQFLIPADHELERLSDNQLLEVFTQYINSFQIMCRNHRRTGMLLDGGKEVCVDDVIRPKSPCLAYSFGRWKDEKKYVDLLVDNRRVRVSITKNSNNQFDFEIEVIKFFGCDVLTFDPTMGEVERATMKIPKGCRFYDKGLESIDMPEQKLYTLDTILKQFNHSERSLDLLKIDIEGSEWSALDEMMSSGTLQNVRQLFVEFHFDDLTRHEKISHLGVFRRLYDYGFRAFSRERNIGKAKFNKELGYFVVFYVEISYVNIRFL